MVTNRKMMIVMRTFLCLFIVLFCCGASFAQEMSGTGSEQMLRDLTPEQQRQLQEYRQARQRQGDDIVYQQVGAPSTGQASPANPTVQMPATGVRRNGKPAAETSETEKFFADSLSDVKRPREKVERASHNLKQFGFDFFKNAGAFTADSASLVGPDYVLGPGDSLRIDVWGNIEGHYQVTIDRNGEIVLPKVGVVNLWGQSFAQAKESVRNQIAKYFKQFQVNVSLDALRAINVFIVGEVVSPGSYQISSLNTVLTALSVAGGPAKTGSLRNVKVVRGGQDVAHVDFYDFLQTGNNSSDIRLQSGDTILVPVSGPQVGIAGNVRRAGIYEILPGESLGDLLKMAGGVVSTAYLQKVRIERVEDHKYKSVMDVELSGGMGDQATAMTIPLQDRDLVEISSIADASGYVVLNGYVARPGEYQLTQNMRLADVILPYDNLLPEYFPGLAQIIRYSPPEYRPESLSIDLEKALNGDPAHNIKLQEYDEIKLFSREQMEETPQVVVSGAVLNPGTFRLYDNMTVKDLVTLAGNVKRVAYLKEAEITRYLPEADGTRTERHLLNLGQALAGDPEHDLQLFPDDHLIVRSIPDSGEKYYIQIEGEVMFPGSYAISKGERLSSVLERAGGFTDKAYLRGAVFTRETLKAVQRQQIEKLIFEQEQEVYRVSSELAAGAFDQAQAEAAQLNLESRKQLLQKLRQAPVTGRMIIHVTDLDDFRGSAYDIEVLPGDTLRIPEDPKSVTVLGQVYNPTSMAYLPGKPVAYYLSQVGGLKKAAEEDEMFIVRANGTVVSKQQGGMGIKWDSENWRWVVGGFNVTELYPGDTVLVPEEVKSTDWMREMKDISTIIYQMALGAAAVASF